MNRLVVIAISILFSLTVDNNASAQAKKSGGIQSLAMNGNHKAAHSEGQPDKVPHGSKWITFPVKGEKPGRAVYVPADEPSDRVLLIFHEWWGLNNFMETEAETWHAMMNGKANVYVVDLFDGKIATDPDAAAKLAGEMDAKRGQAIIKGVLAAAGPTAKHVGTLGFGFGGNWSLNAAVLAGNKADACVIYYSFPEKNLSRIKPLKSDVLYIRATQDNFTKESDVNELARMVKATGHSIDIKSYDAVHAFANPDNPKQDGVAATAAQHQAEDFLKSKLKIQ